MKRALTALALALIVGFGANPAHATFISEITFGIEAVSSGCSATINGTVVVTMIEVDCDVTYSFDTGGITNGVFGFGFEKLMTNGTNFSWDTISTEILPGIGNAVSYVDVASARINSFSYARGECLVSR